MIAVDISAESLGEHKHRWEKSRKPYALKAVAMNASNNKLARNFAKGSPSSSHRSWQFCHYQNDLIFSKDENL
jgi:hypothetical protein